MLSGRPKHRLPQSWSCLATCALAVMASFSALAAPLMNAHSLVFDTGRAPRAVAAADFNGDHRQDVAVLNFGTSGTGNPSVSIFLSDESRTLRSHGQIPTSDYAAFLIGTELTGDGIPDLVAGTGRGANILVGLGDGSFMTQDTLVTNPLIHADAADITRDGTIDLITCDYNGSIQTFRGTGGGHFQLVDSLQITGAAQVHAADFDRDGVLDLAVGFTGSVGIFKGIATGGFLARRNYPAIGGDVLVPADVDEDGILDLITGGSVLIGTGSAEFGAPVPTQSLSSGPLQVLDVNGDSHLDIVRSSGGSDATTVGISNGFGNGLFAPVLRITARPNLATVFVVDVDADGVVDLVGPVEADNDLHVILGNADGTFGSGRIRDVGGGVACTKARLNDDAFEDLAVVKTNSNAVDRWTSLGNGTFAYAGALDTGVGPRGIEAVDMTGDGLDEFFVTRQGDASVTLIGPPSGTAWSTGLLPEAVKSGRIDSDAFLDLVVVNAGSNSVSVLLGLPGGFAPKRDTATGAGPQDVTVTDLNADGFADVVTANKNANTISVFPGLGTGSFGTRQDLATPSQPAAIRTADFDRDGKPDVVVANRNTRLVSVFRGLGNGSFATRQDYPVGAVPVAVEVLDVDGDGRLDIATANHAPRTISVLLGLPNGTFDSKRDYGLISTPEDLAAIDLNGDGARDLVTVGTAIEALINRQFITPVAVDIAAEVLESGVRIDWDLHLVLEGVTGIVVQRATNLAGPYISLGSQPLPPEDRAYLDTTVAPNADFWYRVLLVRSNGEGWASRAVVVHTTPGMIELALAITGAGHSGSIAIRYSVPGTAPSSSLTIYDAAGRRVRTLARDTRTHGSIVREWDLRDDQGRRVARGAYYVELVAGARRLGRKALILGR